MNAAILDSVTYLIMICIYQILLFEHTEYNLYCPFKKLGFVGISPFRLQFEVADLKRGVSKKLYVYL